MKRKNFRPRFLPLVQLELNFFASLQEVTAINAAQIQMFKDTYWAHSTERTDIRDAMSQDFIDALATDAAIAKTELRHMLRYSPYWNEDIQACVLPLVHKYTPDFDRAKSMRMILDAWSSSYKWQSLDSAVRCNLFSAACFLAAQAGEESEDTIEAVHRLIPRKFWRKKKTTIFAKISEIHGLTGGYKYNHLQEEIAYWLNGKDINYKLYVSINPAHCMA